MLDHFYLYNIDFIDEMMHFFGSQQHLFVLGFGIFSRVDPRLGWSLLFFQNAARQGLDFLQPHPS